MVWEVHGHGYIILKIKMLWCISLVLKQFEIFWCWSGIHHYGHGATHAQKLCWSSMHNCIGNEFIQVQATDMSLLGSFPPTDLDWRILFFVHWYGAAHCHTHFWTTTCEHVLSLVVTDCLIHNFVIVRCGRPNITNSRKNWLKQWSQCLWSI